ncbi:MAG: hypothetical protein ACRD9Q_10550, partial [Nitrososphaeraceae archaeon]
FNGILKMNNNVNSNIAEKLMAHKKGLDGSYLKPTREECFAEFLKAVHDLTISDEERLRLENQQKQQEIDELDKKNQEIRNLAKRIEHLEFGPTARFDSVAEGMFNLKGDDTNGRMLAKAFWLWFEMRATEDEKRQIWKKLQQAKENGEKVDISILGESGDLSWKNLINSFQEKVDPIFCNKL